MRKKTGATPEARKRAYKAKRRRRLKRQAELVEQVRAAWAVERARPIDGVVVGRDASGEEVRIVIGARALMYENLYEESEVISTDPDRRVE